ncbi:hypothetical protein FNJ84_14385 [Paracoccus sp. M683]|uniref:hypothetical protein n=1 Tax=Paracoccus sp. M683 TaxID=2594268 RepID=UPI00117D662B|nr:hypothetical protein [Paracoccus sp. M683]TRW96029.1 hypothetical protein FNJ84_14385 [Paracoccus sp. M683]
MVNQDHPQYRAAYDLCDQQIYGPGFKIGDTVYTTKQDSFAQIRPLLGKPNKSRDELDTLRRWSDDIQPRFIKCLEDRGFVTVLAEN